MAEDRTSKRRQRKRNRHHLFYPRYAWCAVGKNARKARRKSIIRINAETHAQLHYELDCKLGKKITRDMLPDKRDMRRVVDYYEKDRARLSGMSPIAKTEWLIRIFNPKKESNRWVLRMLKIQLSFLKEHAEEI